MESIEKRQHIAPREEALVESALPDLLPQMSEGALALAVESAC